MRAKQERLRQGALQIVERLREGGHVAYLAGGCVRDMLLGQIPKDFDVATDALPEAVQSLFRKTRAVGAKFGVILVFVRPHWIEVATFRTDSDYADGRRPTSVRFSTPQEDAQRRDFTINGMFVDPQTGAVVDYVGGQQDLHDGVIRAIGDPARRFEEDHLRMMRAVRFATRLGFGIDPATYEAIRTHAPSIRQISDERVREELMMILTDPRRSEGLRLLADSGLLRHVLPEIGDSPPRLREVQAVVTHLPHRIAQPLALAALLFPLAGGGDSRRAIDDICRRLRCSNELRKAVSWLVEYHAALDEPESLSLGRLRLLMGNRGFHSLTLLHEARAQAAGRSWESQPAWRALVRRVDPHNILPPPLLNGYDLTDMGLAPGPAFKKILDAVYLAQLDERVMTRKQALALAREHLPERGSRDRA